MFLDSALQTCYRHQTETPLFLDSRSFTTTTTSDLKIVGDMVLSHQQQPTGAPAKRRNKSSRRSQAERSSEMRGRICEATIATLCDIGFEKLSLANVAERAGISRGAITHHFKSKNEILVGAFGFIIAKFHRDRLIFLEQHQEPKIDDLVRFLWKQTFSHPNYIASIDLMLAARGNPELQAGIKSIYREWIKVRDVLNKDFLGDDVGGIPRERYIELMLSTMRGIAVSSSIDADKRNHHLLIEDLIKITRHLIGPTGTEKAEG